MSDHGPLGNEGYCRCGYFMRQSLDVCVPELQERLASTERERDVQRIALKDIIALQDRTFGATLANVKLRQAQAIAQDALAAALTAHNLQSVVD